MQGRNIICLYRLYNKPFFKKKKKKKKFGERTNADGNLFYSLGRGGYVSRSASLSVCFGLQHYSKSYKRIAIEILWMGPEWQKEQLIIFLWQSGS